MNESALRGAFCLGFAANLPVWQLRDTHARQVTVIFGFMKMGDAPISNNDLARKVAGLLFFCLTILGTIPLALRGFFLPISGSAASSQNWLPFFLVGLLLSIPILFVFSRQASSQDSSKIFIYLGTPPFLSFFLYMAYSVGLPLIYTAVFGEERSMQAIVEDPQASYQKGCSHRIELKDIPFFFDNLCGFRDEFRHSLKPGDKLIISGRGSRFGIFVRTVEKAE